MATLPRSVSATFAVCALASFVGCAGGPGSAGSGPPAEAPAYRVGDRWVYHGDDGFRVKTETGRARGQVVSAGERAVQIAANGEPVDIPYEQIVRANLIDEGK